MAITTGMRNVATALRAYSEVGPACTVMISKFMLAETGGEGAMSVPKRISELRQEGFVIRGGQADGMFCSEHKGRVAEYEAAGCFRCLGHPSFRNWCACEGVGLERTKPTTGSDNQT